MSETNRAITVANDDSLSKLIRSAKERVVVMAPAVNMPVAEAIADRWAILGPEAVVAIVDVDPEVYRMGYGELKALETLEKAAADVGTTLNQQAGIRIGLVIVDDTTIVFSPTPQLIEAGPKKSDTPNAIVFGRPPQEIQSELGLGPNGARDQIVGLDKAEKAKISEVKENLDRNPPQQFDIARTVRVFNTYFEFVDFELSGLQIQRRTAHIPSDLMGLAKDAKTQSKLQASFKLIDESSNVSGKGFQECKKRLVNENLTLLPSYGYVVLRTVKPKFEKKIRQLKRAIKRFQERVKEGLQEAMDESRSSLAEALLPAVRNSPPKRWQKHFDRELSEQLARRLLDNDLQKAFRSAEALAKEMKVKLVFKGVTYESLQDDKFVELARMKLPALDELYSEYDAAKPKDEDDDEDKLEDKDEQ